MYLRFFHFSVLTNFTTNKTLTFNNEKYKNRRNQTNNNTIFKPNENNDELSENVLQIKAGNKERIEAIFL